VRQFVDVDAACARAGRVSCCRGEIVSFGRDPPLTLRSIFTHGRAETKPGLAAAAGMLGHAPVAILPAPAQAEMHKKNYCEILLAKERII
jgi:hypothetical protein